MLIKSKVRFGVLIGIAVLLIFILGIYLPNLVVKYSKENLTKNYVSHDAKLLDGLEVQIAQAFKTVIKNINLNHKLIYHSNKEQTESEHLAKLFEVLKENKGIVGLAYIDETGKIASSFPELTIGKTDAIGSEAKLFGDQYTKWFPELKNRMELTGTSQMSPIFNVEPHNSKHIAIFSPDIFNKQKNKNTSETYLVTFIQLYRYMDGIRFFRAYGDTIIWLMDLEGNIIYHPIQKYAAKNILTADDISIEQKDFIQKALKNEHYSGKYDLTLPDSNKGIAKISVSKKIKIGTQDIILVKENMYSHLVSHLDATLRGTVIILLVISIIMLSVGQFWLRKKKIGVEEKVKSGMNRELEKMVEARTVELNFVTRTIKDLIDSIPSALLVLDRQLNVLLVNLSFYSIFSSRMVNITGRNITEIFSEDFSARMQKIMRTKEPIIDLQMRKYIEGQGEKVLQVNVLHLLGKRDRLLMVIDDITERKVLERQLIQAEKMSGLGTLMSGIAHEINNPLNAIAGMAQIILAREQSEETKADGQQILQYVKRVAEIVKELSRYSRSSKVTDAITTDIHSIIEGALGMVRHSRKLQDVELEKNFAHDLPSIKVNVVEIEQIFINLMTNSIDALEETGKNDDSENKKKISITTSIHGGEFVQIELEDNGPGIKPENLKKIFDPFFSTKEQGKGTGLGLSISYKIMQRYGGIILVESQINMGAKFIIRLPITKKSA